MYFIDENSEPAVIRHVCEHEREGCIMSQRELQKFAKGLIIELLQNSGMVISEVNKIKVLNYPMFIMQTRLGTRKLITVLVSAFPNSPTLELPIVEKIQIDTIAKEYNAIPVVAPISFANAMNRDLSKLVCGSSFFVSFRGLVDLPVFDQ